MRAQRGTPSTTTPMKVASWNVENALRCLPALPEIVRELGTPDVVCLQEIRIRPQDADAIRALEGAVPGYRCHHALARDPRNVVYFDEEGCVAGDRHALKRRFQSDVMNVGRELRRNGGVIRGICRHLARTPSAEILPLLPWSDHAPISIELSGS